jgi:diguanylate cyclase (GGDEF)-like protein
LTDLQDAQAALIEQATHDSLTGLPNRGLLVDRINQALFQAGRSRRCTGVLFIDLDGFKEINDTQGHAAGDVTLQRVARRLVAVLRPMDTVSRIGGDEFVVLAPDLDSHLHAVDIGTRLVSHLHDRREGGGRPLTASIGIAISMAGEGTAETLLDEADTAMYRAKSLGGGRTEVFDVTLGRQVRHRSAAQRVLQSALDDHRLLPFYQPIVDLNTGVVTGFEALARITEADGRILPPSEFIPVAEESGLVVPLGARVLEMACAEARGWHEAGLTPAPLTVAVNTSSRQFEPGDLTAVVRDQLETTGLDPAHLHLELTETTIMGLHPDIVRQLVRIRDLGVQIGLDDFGTGYASLTHLRRLPLTFVKIDRSFVQGLEKGHHDERIVSAVVDLAGNLGLRSIAEGVETAAQLDRLRELGCDQGQGYLFAKPMPPSAVPAMLSQPAIW